MRWKKVLEQEEVFTPGFFIDLDGVLVSMESSFSEAVQIGLPDVIDHPKLGKLFTPENVEVLTSGMSISDIRSYGEKQSSPINVKRAMYAVMQESINFWSSLAPLGNNHQTLPDLGRRLVKEGIVSESSVLTGTVGFNASPNGKKQWLEKHGVMSKLDRFLFTQGGKKYTTFGSKTRHGDILVDDRPHKEFYGKWDTNGYGIYFYEGCTPEVVEKQVRDYVESIRAGEKPEWRDG